MIYTLTATVDIVADSEHEAYTFLRHALSHAKKAEIVYLDSEVVATRSDADDDAADNDARHPSLTRSERHQLAADHGCDTWEEYRGER